MRNAKLSGNPKVTKVKNLEYPEFVEQIFEKFEKSGFEIYVVGGVVRDLLSGRASYDWDFTTNATPEEILELYPQGFYDNKFGTVGIPDESHHHPYEITTYRTESEYSDNRRPDKVEWGKNLEEDLSRRDFTINALALNSKGEVVDYFNGTSDLNKKLIRAVGNPAERFKEDALRMMRAVRIAAEIGGAIEPKTLSEIEKDADLIKNIAAERIREELFKLLKSDYAARGIEIFRQTGLLKIILPELENCFGVEQKSPERHHKYDVGTHALKSLEFCPSPDPLVRFATLIHDIGKAKTQKVTSRGVITFYNHEVVGSRMVKDIAERLRLSKAQKEKLWLLVRWHQFTVDEKQTDASIRRFIKKVGRDNIQDMLDLRTGDRLGGGAAETSWRLEEFKKRIEEVQKQPFSVKDLKISGRDVMQVLDIPSGPQVGKILDALFKEIEEDQKKNTKDYLLHRIKEIDREL